MKGCPGKYGRLQKKQVDRYFSVRMLILNEFTDRCSAQLVLDPDEVDAMVQVADIDVKNIGASVCFAC